VSGTLATALERAEAALAAGDLRGALLHAAVADDSEAAAPLHLVAGRAALRLLELDRARASLARAAAGSADPVRAAEALRELGRAEELAGRLDAAEHAWREALRLAADDRDHLALAALACRRGDLATADAELGAVASAATALVRGELALARGDAEAAARAWREALDEAPRVPDAPLLRRRLAELDLGAGRVDRALDELIDLCRDAQHAGDRHELAVLLRLTGSALRRSGDRESAGWFLGRARAMAAALPNELARVEAEEAELSTASRLDLDAVTEELRAASGASRASLQLIDEPGSREVGDDTLLAALAAAAPVPVAGALVAPLLLDERPLGIARLELAGPPPDAALVGALAARAAVAVESLRFRGGALRRAELRAVLAHQVRNPLAGILGFSELLPDEAAELPANVVHLMARIQGDARRLKGLVESLLDLVGTRGDAAESWCPARVPLAALLGRLRERFAPLAERGGVTLSVEADDVDAFAAGERLYHALAVLLLDALAVPGAVLLRARRDPAAPSSAAPHGRVVLEVARSGPVLDPASLGYEIAREIARRHGGSLRVAGATVSFTVPAARVTV
jgi:signal transduction histidine kinase